MARNTLNIHSSIFVHSSCALQEKKKKKKNLLLLCVLPKIRSSVYRQQLVVALMMHFSQQFSGINAVSDKLISTLHFFNVSRSLCCS